MIRPILTELALFLTPFVVYAIVLTATRAGVLDAKAWSSSRLAWLTITALTLVVGSFVVIAEFSGAPPNSTYVPAHVENGRFVPGTTK
jgi:heme/copper-type cytochrome/quinol oxidase subunit 3